MNDIDNSTKTLKSLKGSSNFDIDKEQKRNNNVINIDSNERFLSLMQIEIKKYLSDEKQIIEWIKQICDILDRLHSKNIYNQKITLDNLCITKFDTIALKNVRISKSENENKVENAQKDIYSLGLFLSSLISTNNISDIKVLESIKNIIRKCIDNSISYRYQSIEEIQIDLLNITFEGKYKIKKVIGRGGMGKVYLAETINLGTKWALKQVNKQINKSIDLSAEPQILKGLKHPSIPIIIDIEEDSLYLYIIEEYVEGYSLKQYVKMRGRVNEKMVIKWSKEIVNALQYLHENNIIHRDLKPDNIMLTPKGKIKLIDFGISRRDKYFDKIDRVGMGTEGYAAPEQYSKYKSDARTDIYSFGMTLYYLLTGMIPSRERIHYSFPTVKEINKKVSEGMDFIINKCIQPLPNKRYQSVKKLYKDIDNIKKLNKNFRKKKNKKYLKKIFIIICSLICLSLIYIGAYKYSKIKVIKYNEYIEHGKKLTKEFKYEEARIAFANANITIPSRVQGYELTAKNYLKQKKYDKCVQYVQQSVTYVKQISRYSELYYIASCASYANKDYNESIYFLRKAIEYKNNEEKYYKDLCRCYIKTGRLKEIEKLLKNLKNNNMPTDFIKEIENEVSSLKN